MRSIAELSKNILKCTRCGNCQYYCPSFTTSRLETHVARGRLQLIKRRLDDQADYNETFIKRINQCLLCGNCSVNCPAGINTEEIVEYFRGLSVKQAGASHVMSMTAKNIESVGNITGDGRENRLLWAENMDAGSVRIGEPAEYIYYAGCVSALYPSSYSIPQTFAKLLNIAGLDWSVMGETENCCAYPLVIGGMGEEAVRTMQENAKAAGAFGARVLVTTCPSCYNMWTEVYPKILTDMPDVRIYHGSQLLAELVKKNAFRFKETDAVVTYHDPCDLGRKCSIYDEPREVLSAIPGINLVEMKFNRGNAFCCGGGGNIEMNDPELGGKVAQQRVSQALDAGAQVIVTSCQQCKRTLTGGARQLRARIKVMDLSEFILGAIEE